MVTGWIFSGWPRIWQNPPVPSEIQEVKAATAGPNSPSSAVEDTTSGGILSWSNYTNVYSNDGSYATVSTDKGEISYYIKATGFNFSPSGCSSISGIYIEVDRYSNDVADMRDYSVRLVNGSGTIVGDNKADTVTDWPTSDAYATYGGSADTWNAGLSCSDVINSNFGIVFSVKNYVATKPRIIIASVDHIRVTITYSTAVVSVSLSDGVVSYGSLVAGNSEDTTASGLNDTQTATNDGNVTENFNIIGQNSASWALSGTTGSETYVHDFCTSGTGSPDPCDTDPTWIALTTSYQTLATSVTVSDTQKFDLRITVPTITTDYTQQSVSVTVQAVQAP